MTEPPRQAQTATVIGRWGDDMALLRTEDGTTVEAAVPEPLRDEFDVGTSVHLSADGAIDWYELDRQRD